MRHRSISLRVRLTVLLAAIAATVGCDSTALPTAPMPQLDPLTVVGIYDLVGLPMRVDSINGVLRTIVAARLTIDLARTWNVLRTDRYVTAEAQSDSEKTILSGTWKVEGSALALSASGGKVFVSPQGGDKLSMWEECTSPRWTDCFYSTILIWQKRPPVVEP